MKSLSNSLWKQIGPAYLGGFSCLDWIRFLSTNQWDIDGWFLPRAVHASLRSLATSCIKCFEDRIDLSAADQQVWQKPVFLLGLPRSGTTHLFNLLARDSRFGFPSRFDVFNPHTFLTLRRLGLHRVLAWQPASKRPMDNVEVGWLSPEEDNIALGILAGSGPRVESVFPKLTGYAERFRPSEERSEEERRDFRAALALFTKKLVCANSRPLILKSPAHALSIEDILTVFPEAKFVGIIRSPEEQFSSLRHMHAVTDAEGWAALQTSPRITDVELLARIRQHVRAYTKGRRLIRAENLIEIRYENLVRDQAGTMSRIYSRLGLGMPAEFSSPESEKPYLPNRHAAPKPSLAEQLREIYQPFYDAGLLNENADRSGRSGLQ